MERVGALINKLQEQYLQHADANIIAVTAQMLLVELQQNNNEASSCKKVSVLMPGLNTMAAASPAYNNNNGFMDQPSDESKETKIYNTISSEKNGSAKNNKEAGSWIFDSVPEAPTLTQQTTDKQVIELNEAMAINGESLNEKLRVEKIELGTVLKDLPIRDLKKAIGINDRYLFINDLFRGDETMYERSIKTINSFSIFAEAEYWIKRELKSKLGWNENSEATKLFDQLTKRRFS